LWAFVRIDFDFGRLGDGIIIPDLLDESSVPGSARVGRDDPVEGPLLGAHPLEPEFDCHILTSVSL
jgi:hypothetical protein